MIFFFFEQKAMFLQCSEICYHRPPSTSIYSNLYLYIWPGLSCQCLPTHFCVHAVLLMTDFTGVVFQAYYFGVY